MDWHKLPNEDVVFSILIVTVLFYITQQDRAGILLAYSVDADPDEIQGRFDAF